MSAPLLVVVFALIFASSAGAATGDKPPGVNAPPRTEQQKLAAYLDVARSYWPGSACKGREVIELNADEQIAALGGAQHGRAGGYGDPAGCRVWMRGGLTPERFCLILAHELGHTAGQAHTDDPGSVMHASALPTVGPCADYRFALSAGWYMTITQLPHAGRGWRIVAKGRSGRGWRYDAVRPGFLRRTLVVYRLTIRGPRITGPRQPESSTWSRSCHSSSSRARRSPTAGIVLASGDAMSCCARQHR